MKVLQAPFFEENQYQNLLVNSLEDEDIEVVKSSAAVPLTPLFLHVLWNNIDVLHLHWTHPYFLFGSKERFYAIPGVKYLCTIFAVIFLLQVRLAAWYCNRVVWTVHNKHNHERRFLDLDRWVSSRVADQVDVLQMWDESTRREGAQYFGVPLAKTVAIPHGNYCQLYPDPTVPSETLARDRLGVAGYDRVFLYFGIIRPYKQVPHFIDTFERAELSDACLIVAGNTKYKELEIEIARKAAGRNDIKTVLEYVPDEEVPTYFAACDFAVFPYDDIFNSGSVILAMSLGVPFVAPPKGTIPSIDPGENVLYDSLAEGLVEAYRKSDADIEEIGRLNSRFAESELSWGQIGKQIACLYRNKRR
jgi:glycosyltransferase involved in cell wall biosynthesis